MKTKVNTWINAILVAILGMLGFSSCKVAVEYGTPSGDFTLEGEVTNEAKEPLQDIQIVLRRSWKDSSDSSAWTTKNTDTLYTGADGRFYKYYPGVFPLEYNQVIATDTSGVYKSDTIDAHVSYSGGDGHWNSGKAQLTAEFVLKRF